MHKCRFCGREYDNYHQLAGHASKCKLNPNLKNHKKHNGNNKPHTTETKAHLSKKRKEYLAKNKDKHNWSVYRNKESEPEKLFRLCLEKMNINEDIIQWYIPPEGNRFFEIDFAIPNKKLGFEINGLQHYTKTGDLKEYYENRRNYFINHGWNIIEILYTMCFNEDTIKNIIVESLEFKVSFLDHKIKEIIKGREKRKLDRIHKIKIEVELRDAAKILKMEELKIERKKLLDEVDLTKLGWISMVAEKWNTTNRQVKRYIKEFYPEVEYYENLNYAGSCNSQYGTCWIYNLEEEKNKKIKKEKLDEYLKLGWTKGMKTNWTLGHVKSKWT